MLKAFPNYRILVTALEQTHEGIAIIDTQGTVLYSNHAFANMHGYSSSELQGKNLSIFHISEQMPQVESAIRETLETGSFTGEIWHSHKNGTAFPAMMHTTLIRNDDGNAVGLIGTMRDITGLNQHTEELLEIREMLENVLNAIPDILGIQDLSHGIISYNEAGYKYLGITPEEARGRKCYELIGRDRPCEKCAASLVYNSLKPESAEKYVPEMDIWLDVRAYPILDRSGKLVKVIEHLRDIT